MEIKGLHCDRLYDRGAKIEEIWVSEWFFFYRNNPHLPHEIWTNVFIYIIIIQGIYYFDVAGNYEDGNHMKYCANEKMYWR